MYHRSDNDKSNALWLICMYPYLIWNIGPPSLMIHRPRVPLFAFQSFLCSFDAFAHSCDSHHSDVSAVPILGCPRQLLLSLFIKLDSAPKCGVAWFILKDFLSWILLRIILWLVVCIMPTPIKVVNQSWTCLKLKHTLQVCYHQPSWNCQVIQTCIS